MSVNGDFRLPHSTAGPQLGFSKVNLFQQLTHMLGVLPSHAQDQHETDSDVANQSSQTMMAYNFQLDVVKELAQTIASDVVLNFDIVNPKKPPNVYCTTMRRCVKELSTRHEIVFKGMINKLKLNEDNFFSTFVMVADEIFQDGQVNWGRIVSVFCFAARIAKYHRDVTGYSSSQRPLEQPELESHQHRIASFVGKYVANKLGKWILDHGGWDTFVEFFPDQAEFEEKLWKGLLFTAIGFGALATMVVSR